MPRGHKKKITTAKVIKALKPLRSLIALSEEEKRGMWQQVSQEMKYVICECGIKINANEVKSCPVCEDRVRKARAQNLPDAIKRREIYTRSKAKKKRAKQ